MIFCFSLIPSGTKVADSRECGVCFQHEQVFPKEPGTFSWGDSMKYVVILLLLGFLLSCNVVDPVSLSGAVEKISPEAFANATVTILHEEGYTIETVDPVAGVVTTAWRDESSYASQTFLDVSRRTRISDGFFNS